MSTLGKKTVEDIEVKGRNVLVRCDFNVPMKDGVITNDNRIVAALPTIKKLIENGGRVILCSHLGKPKNGPEEKFSLAPVAVRLSELLGKPVVFANDDNVAGENAKAAVAAMQDGDVVPVSYTHLDVYKRQPRHRAACCATSAAPKPPWLPCASTGPNSRCAPCFWDVPSKCSPAALPL